MIASQPNSPPLNTTLMSHYIKSTLLQAYTLHWRLNWPKLISHDNEDDLYILKE